ncbi:PREDICTED: interleukin-12 subunit alpha [Lepidothrix coronata]|uniref:Interleukin-12 subunit alpha n=1 Tax=Lepidothrix coronata TaxID=321398 RepID=A0A6J0IJS2_9PASS|nr:PREDICTED: interleukin-12 subunit alpha [Lepidothrix coronata]
MERSGSTESGSGITGIIGITGNTGSGRAAPPGGPRGALLPALCLLLALLPLPPARALPTPSRALPTPEALNRSRELLEAADTSLQRLKELDTLGFECTLEEVDPEDITKNQTNTIKACTSEGLETGNCPALEGSTFDKRKCLQGIYEDLSAYRAELNNFHDHQVLASLDEMMKVSIFCLLPLLRDLKNRVNTALNSSRKVPEPPAGAGLESFPARLRLCRVLQALRIRSLTISRMMNFLSSPESSL